MTAATIEIATDDGRCPAFLFGDPARPPVLVYMDGLGMRPALHAIAERIAGAGYHVMLPDMFYRMGAYTPPPPAAIFGDPAVRTEWMTRARGVTGPAQAMADTRAFLDHLGPRVATTGYCMGGRYSLTAAATFPDRIVAAASYHPGGLATDADDSPHRLVGSIKARIYVAGASDDANFPDEQKQRLGDALREAGVDHVIETYPARHGWVPSDTPVHDPACAERHFDSLFALLRDTLG